MNYIQNRWVAAQVRPRHELFTAQILRNQGYEGFVPLYRTKRKWSDREREVSLPLFSSYVFCRATDAILCPIVSTPGVIRLVKDGTRIAVIDDEGIDAIRAIEKLGIQAEPCRRPQLQERVRVMDGPLAGLEGLYIRNKKDRFVLSVDAINRCVSIEIAGFRIAPVDAAAPVKNGAC